MCRCVVARKSVYYRKGLLQPVYIAKFVTMWHGLDENFKKAAALPAMQCRPVVALHNELLWERQQKAASFSFGQQPSKAGCLGPE